jgi:hypothetical protein
MCFAFWVRTVETLSDFMTDTFTGEPHLLHLYAKHIAKAQLAEEHDQDQTGNPHNIQPV